MKYFIAYLTANELDYSMDLVNLKQFTKYHPGIENQIELYIVVSEVHKRSSLDKWFAEYVENIFRECEWINIRATIFKANIGRDFSSLSVCLETLGDDFSPEDIIMVRNRSAYGPFSDQWLSNYTDLLLRHDKIGLVGNTINFSGFWDTIYNFQPTHVQTYLYVSKLGVLSSLMSDFPGSKAITKDEAVNDGEIGLSRRVLERGFGITCLLWPECHFTKDYTNDPSLPQENVLSKVRNLPFAHSGAYKRYPNRLLIFRSK
ncbi:unnamed protein product, partial [Chrysoparadoxa australica]